MVSHTAVSGIAYTSFNTSPIVLYKDLFVQTMRVIIYMHI